MLRFSFIILVMGVDRHCHYLQSRRHHVCRASILERRSRPFCKKKNVTVRPTRGNIISSDGQLMASSLPEYKIYMDFMINKRKGETEEEEKTRLKLQHIKDSVLYANLDTICKGLHEIFPDKSAAFFKQHIKNGRKKGEPQLVALPQTHFLYTI
mgnify:CR=1 FL=1